MDRRLSAFFTLLLVAAGPRYTADGGLVPPADYREWVFLSSGLDMSYTEAAPMAGRSMFDNVFVDPDAWHGFEKTGHWPDKAVFVLESRGAAGHLSINQHGQVQTGEVMGLAAHVHDAARFPGGWAFFALDVGGPWKLIPATESCYSCHLAHGAVDTTFTQFYPTRGRLRSGRGISNRIDTVWARWVVRGAHPTPC